MLQVYTECSLIMYQYNSFIPDTVVRLSWYRKEAVFNYVQGSANPQTPGSKNKRMKSCVLLPAAGRGKQLFHLIFSEPGVCGFADPCTTSPLPINFISSDGCLIHGRLKIMPQYCQGPLQISTTSTTTTLQY